MRADLLLSMCARFNRLPSEVMGENASVLRMIAIERRGFPERYEQPES